MGLAWKLRLSVNPWEAQFIACLKPGIHIQKAWRRASKISSSSSASSSSSSNSRSRSRSRATPHHKPTRSHQPHDLHKYVQLYETRTRLVRARTSTSLYKLVQFVQACSLYYKLYKLVR